MTRTAWKALVSVLLAVAGTCFGQSSTAPGIDLELYNAADGTNRACVEAASSFWANVYVRPGSDAFTCTPECAPPDVAGGTTNLAAAAIDVAFDPTRLTYVQAENNASSAAVDGLVQAQNLAAGRVGWALAGDWTPDADPSAGMLATPCAMQKLSAVDWVVRFQFTGSAPGMTLLHLQRAADAFPLSFADVCGTPAFTESSGAIDEVGDLVVLVADTCDGVLFFDSYERGDMSMWSGAVGGSP